MQLRQVSKICLYVSFYANIILKFPILVLTVDMVSCQCVFHLYFPAYYEPL